MGLEIDLLGKEIEVECYACGHHTHKTQDVLFNTQITHNLVPMAKAAHIYILLWKPYILTIELAKDLIEPLTSGLRDLRDRPEYFKRFNHRVCGKYINFVVFVEGYLQACKDNPDAKIRVA